MRKSKSFLIVVAMIIMVMAVSAQAVQRLVLIEYQTNTN